MFWYDPGAKNRNRTQTVCVATDHKNGWFTWVFWLVYMGVFVGCFGWFTWVFLLGVLAGLHGCFCWGFWLVYMGVFVAIQVVKAAVVNNYFGRDPGTSNCSRMQIN